MRVRGRSGSLSVLGKELAKLGSYEFEREPLDVSVLVTAKIISIDRFLIRYVESSPVSVKLDFQKERSRQVSGIVFADKSVTFTALWAEAGQESITGTHG